MSLHLDEVGVESLPNLGPRSAGWLRDVGIHTMSDLQRLGPFVAFKVVKQRQPRASLNLLWALAAALVDKDWRDLTDIEERDLRNQLDET